MKKEYKHIFEPFTVRRMTMKNRIMMTPMGTNYGEFSGEIPRPLSIDEIYRIVKKSTVKRQSALRSPDLTL